MRRYQLSGLEHVHMMRHVPRSYDMTRTHIMHKGVNKHVDVVLRCSPKNRKKKKVAVSVVRSEKKADAARIRANARKGYVAVRKVVNDRFEADRKIAASAYETRYGTKTPASDALIHDMKSQIAMMAKKSADYIDDQLTSKPAEPVVSFPDQAAQNVESKPEESQKPLISTETEEILNKGGYRIPDSYRTVDNPYAANYSMHASNDEFHILMDTLEKSLDEACKKYAIEPIAAETEPEDHPESDTSTAYSGYGGYNFPGEVSLSVTNKQEIKVEEQDESAGDYGQSFEPALHFTEGGEHYIPEDDLFDRELGQPGERYVPPAYFFDDDDTTPANEADDRGGDYIPLPDAAEPPVMPLRQEIFYTEEDDSPIEPSYPDDEYNTYNAYDAYDGQVPTEGYPSEDYEQQQIFLPTEPDDEAADRLYIPPEEGDEFAEPTMYPDASGVPGSPDYGPPAFYPDDQDDGQPNKDVFPDDEDDMPPPMIFPDDEDDMPPPMIFPDDDEENGYSPAPVSPDRNEPFDGGGDGGIMNRSGQTFFSRTGDQIKKVIGIIRGSANPGKDEPALHNHNVEITYFDKDK